jgi:hypothetical protein
MEYPQALAHITAAVTGEYDDQRLATLDVTSRCQAPAEHGRCHLCA